MGNASLPWQHNTRDFFMTRLSPRVIAAAFPSDTTLVHAVQWLRNNGYDQLELYTPYPIPHAEELLALKRPRIPLVVLVAGLAGAATGFLAQWYPNAWSYPINVGGRPLLSLPAWVPITFELGVLFGAFAAVFAFLIGSGLPRLWHPLFELEGFGHVSTDEYWLTVTTPDSDVDSARIEHELVALGASRITALQESA